MSSSRRLRELWVLLVEPEVAKSCGSKNELAGYPQEVKGLRSILIAIRTECQVIFALQELSLIACTEFWVVLFRLGRRQVLGNGHRFVGFADKFLSVAWLEVFENLVRHFHDVRIRVVHGTTFNVSHGSSFGSEPLKLVNFASGGNCWA